jgi:hypothetical protein
VPLEPRRLAAVAFWPSGAWSGTWWLLAWTPLLKSRQLYDDLGATTYAQPRII